MNSVLKGEPMSLTLAAAFVQKQGDTCGLVTGETLTREDQGGKLAPAGPPAGHIPPEGIPQTRPPEVQPLKLGGEALLCSHLLGRSPALMPGGLGTRSPRDPRD